MAVDNGGLGICLRVFLLPLVECYVKGQYVGMSREFLDMKIAMLKQNIDKVQGHKREDRSASSKRIRPSLHPMPIRERRNSKIIYRQIGREPTERRETKNTFHVYLHNSAEVVF